MLVVVPRVAALCQRSLRIQKAGNWQRATVAHLRSNFCQVEVTYPLLYAAGEEVLTSDRCPGFRPESYRTVTTVNITIDIDDIVRTYYIIYAIDDKWEYWKSIWAVVNKHARTYEEGQSEVLLKSLDN